MHDSTITTTHTGRHIPFTRGGWGAAAFVCLLAGLCIAGATYMHKRTYLHPTDLRNHAVGASVGSAHE